MSSVKLPTVQRLILDNVDWRSYRRWLRLLDDRPGIRLTYDRGRLEIMTLTFGHESWAHLIGRLIVVLTEELGLPIAGGGSTTFKRKRKRRGLEPDECFWIANESKVRGKTRIDLRIDPPPDLTLEIDITHSSLNRLAIYAALAILEVWRFDGRVLTFLVLAADGKYVEAATSGSFPGLTAADLLPFLALRGQIDENAVVRQFRAWVQQRFATGRPAPTP
jgi:Uma2 family endonuclease